MIYLYILDLQLLLNSVILYPGIFTRILYFWYDLCVKEVLYDSYRKVKKRKKSL